MSSTVPPPPSHVEEEEEEYNEPRVLIEDEADDQANREQPPPPPTRTVEYTLGGIPFTSPPLTTPVEGHFNSNGLFVVDRPPPSGDNNSVQFTTLPISAIPQFIQAAMSSLPSSSSNNNGFNPRTFGGVAQQPDLLRPRAMTASDAMARIPSLYDRDHLREYLDANTGSGECGSHAIMHTTLHVMHTYATDAVRQAVWNVIFLESSAPKSKRADMILASMATMATPLGLRDWFKFVCMDMHAFERDEMPWTRAQILELISLVYRIDRTSTPAVIGNILKCVPLVLSDEADIAFIVGVCAIASPVSSDNTHWQMHRMEFVSVMVSMCSLPVHVDTRMSLDSLFRLVGVVSNEQNRMSVLQLLLFNWSKVPETDANGLGHRITDVFSGDNVDKAKRVIIEHNDQCEARRIRDALAQRRHTSKLRDYKDRAADEGTDEHLVCTMCSANMRCVMLDPCGHMYACASCARKSTPNGAATGTAMKCAYCRVPVDAHNLVILP